MDERRTKTVILLRIICAGFRTHILKTTIRLLMIKRVAFSRQATRATHHRYTTKLTEVLSNSARLARLARTRGQIIEVDNRVTGNEEIEFSIAVVVTPTRSSAPAFAGDA